MAANANGNVSPFNGKSLASLSGAKVRVEERVTFDSRELTAAIEQIRALGATGEMTVRFLSGRPAGEVAWRTSPRQNSPHQDSLKKDT